MSKRINLAATISMILADPNSSFYQNEADENQPIDDGKKIREAFFKAGNSAQKTSAVFSALASGIAEPLFNYQKYFKRRFAKKNILINARRQGKNFLRGLHDNL